MIASLIIALVLFAPAKANSPDWTDRASIQVRVELLDGSAFQGRIERQPLRFRAIYGRQQVLIGEIREIIFDHDNGQHLIVMRSGDTYRGQLDLAALRIQTEPGLLALPLDAVRKIRVRPERELA